MCLTEKDLVPAVGFWMKVKYFLQNRCWKHGYHYEYRLEPGLGMYDGQESHFCAGCEQEKTND